MVGGNKGTHKKSNSLIGNALKTPIDLPFSHLCLDPLHFLLQLGHPLHLGRLLFFLLLLLLEVLLLLLLLLLRFLRLEFIV